MQTTNIKNSYPLKTLTLDCQKRMMRELMMDNKLITSSDFKQPYLEHFKYIPAGTSIEDGNVIDGQFAAYKDNVFIRQMNDYDYQLKYPIVFEIDINENLSASKEEILIATRHDAFRDLLLIKEIRSDGEVWFKIPNSVSSPNLELVIEELRNQIVKRENSCDQDMKAVLVHFKNFIKEIVEHQLKNRAVITKENIHLYYEFMSEDDIKKHKNITHTLLHNRALNILINLHIIDGTSKTFDKDFRNFNHISLVTYKDTGIRLHSFIFGIKDTLKPIDEYVSQIKESEAYQSYIVNSTKA